MAKRIRTHTIVAQPQRHVATADGINYMVTERGAAVVMNQEAPYTGRISVAQSIEYGDDSHDVTIIDDNAFNNFYGSDISSIELPRTLVEIGYAAFSNSENLEGITIPDGVTTIKAYAFSGCHSMTYAKLPSGLETLGKKRIQRLHIAQFSPKYPPEPPCTTPSRAATIFAA